MCFLSCHCALAWLLPCGTCVVIVWWLCSTTLLKKVWILIWPWMTSLIGSCVCCWKIASGLWALVCMCACWRYFGEVQSWKIRSSSHVPMSWSGVLCFNCTCNCSECTTRYNSIHRYTLFVLGPSISNFFKMVVNTLMMIATLWWWLHLRWSALWWWLHLRSVSTLMMIASSANALGKKFGF